MVSYATVKNPRKVYSIRITTPYEAICTAYIANKSDGMNVGDAWMLLAVKAESKQRGASFADTFNRTNAIGNTHRKAIKACAG